MRYTNLSSIEHFAPYTGNTGWGSSDISNLTQAQNQFTNLEYTLNNLYNEVINNKNVNYLNYNNNRDTVDTIKNMADYSRSIYNRNQNNWQFFPMKQYIDKLDTYQPPLADTNVHVSLDNKVIVLAPPSAVTPLTVTECPTLTPPITVIDCPSLVELAA